MYVARRRQNLAEEKNLPLYLCFINLEKAYDVVECSLLCKVLARYSIPAKIISIIRQFFDGMRACVRVDSSKASEWSDGNQGFLQGCVPPSGLFSIFSSAVLTVTFDSFSISKAMAQELICIAESGGRTREVLSKCVGPHHTPATLASSRDLSKARQR